MDRILDELARHADDETRPDVDVYLASGPVLRGRLMAVQQGMATMHLGPAKDPSIAYVRVEQIVAVTVLAASGRSSRSLTPSKGLAIHTPPPTRAEKSSSAPMGVLHSVPHSPSASNDDVITPMQPMSISAVKAALMPEGPTVSDPVAEFVASQYDVITPPDPITPPSLELARPPMHLEALEAPTFLPGQRPRKTPTPAQPDGMTFSMRGGETPNPRPARTPPPSRQDLMRQANVHAEMMSRVMRHRVEIAIAAPLDDDSRRAIGHALPLASDVLLAVLADPKRRAAIDAITSIELVAGDAEVVLDGARLVIRCSLVDRFTAASLRAAIEAAS